jgi:hypothetical protein
MAFQFIAYYLYVLIKSKIDYGFFWKIEESCYFIEGKLDKKFLVLWVFRNISGMGATLLVYYIIYYSVLSGISAAMVVSIFGATSFMCALAFYLIFD